MTIFGDHQCPLIILAPDHHPELVSIVLDSVIVGLGQELVVQDTLSEHKPVSSRAESVSYSSYILKDLPISLLFPEPDLIRDCRRYRWPRTSHTLSMDMHIKKPDDLGCSDPTPKCLPT
jgi:hypothetical protein